MAFGNRLISTGAGFTPQPWKISNAIPDGSGDFYTITQHWDFVFNPTGTRIYAVGVGDLWMRSAPLSVPYDVNTIDTSQWNSQNYYMNTTSRGIAFNPTGTRVFFTTGNKLAQANLSTAYNINTAGTKVVANFGISDPIVSINFFPSGRGSYSGTWSQYYNTNINRYYGWTPLYDITTIDSYGGGAFPSGTGQLGWTFKTDNLKAYNIHGGNVNEYNKVNVEAQPDLSTITDTFAHGVSGACNVKFSPDGSRMYIVSQSQNKIFQFLL